jgi:hypothetical protein
VVASDSTEAGAASGQLGVTDAKGSPAHHAVSVNVTSFRVAHRTCFQSYEKTCPLDHLFLAARAKDRSPRIAPTQGQQGASAPRPGSILSMTVEKKPSTHAIHI